MEEQVYFHEDFYRQIELIPEENYFAAHEYINDLPDLVRTPYGFYGTIARKEQPIEILDRKISLNDINSILFNLGGILFKSIQYGYSSAVYEKENTVAWGFERLGIILEYNINELITQMWLLSSSAFGENNEGIHISKALNVLGKNYNLILVDWDINGLVRISSQTAVNNYLIEVFGFTIDNDMSA